MNKILSPIDIEILDSVFNNGGYILDFTNATFESFFKYFGINIYSDKYAYYGDSKGKRFRRFLEIETKENIVKILKELIKKLDDNIKITKVQKIINDLEGCRQQNNFEHKNLDIENDINNIKENLYKYNPINEILLNRIDELITAYNSYSYFSVMVLCGSILEGVLLSVATKFPKEFNIAKTSPKNKDGKVKPFQNWTLNDFINVAYEIKYLDIVSQKYSHFLREFRNFIHPFEAYSKQHFSFDKKSAEIAIKVLIKAIEDLDTKI